MEKPLLSRADGRWRLSLGGWSLPFYLLLLGDLVFGLGLTLDLGWQSAVATLLYALVVGVLAQHWQLKALGYLTVGLSLAALAQRLLWLESPPEVWPQALAVWSLVVGAAGYGLRRWARDDEAAPGWRCGNGPLVRGGWAASLLALGLAGVIGGGLGTAVPQIVLFGGGLTLYQTAAAQMLIRTFALLGLFYLTAALAENRPRLSYLALLLLFAAWSLWLLAIQGARELQLYAIPAGFYLLLLGWLEWQRGSQAAGRWLDWIAVSFCSARRCRSRLAIRGTLRLADDWRGAAAGLDGQLAAAAAVVVFGRGGGGNGRGRPANRTAVGPEHTRFAAVGRGAGSPGHRPGAAAGQSARSIARTAAEDGALGMKTDGDILMQKRKDAKKEPPRFLGFFIRRGNIWLALVLLGGEFGGLGECGQPGEFGGSSAHFAPGNCRDSGALAGAGCGRRGV
ncbi:MAG: hypothetical protein IPG51_04765 [Chloroflexi bacterium]|nr:hypothetical protein [Chloroflexota bacterium]